MCRPLRGDKRRKSSLQQSLEGVGYARSVRVTCQLPARVLERRHAHVVPQRAICARLNEQLAECEVALFLLLVVTRAPWGPVWFLPREVP